MELDSRILTCRERPEEGVKMAEEMLTLLGKEGISAPRTVAQVCNDGYQLAVLAGDKDDTQVWAHMSYEAHRLGWGEDYPMTREMLHYSMNPPTPATSAPSPARARAGGPKIAGTFTTVPAAKTPEGPPVARAPAAGHESVPPESPKGPPLARAPAAAGPTAAPQQSPAGPHVVRDTSVSMKSEDAIISGKEQPSAETMADTKSSLADLD